LDRLPNLFITVAPAEWKFPLHLPTLGGAKDARELSNVQGILTLRMREAGLLFNIISYLHKRPYFFKSKGSGERVAIHFQEQK
jgi:hypothetical protein